LDIERVRLNNGESVEQTITRSKTFQNGDRDILNELSKYISISSGTAGDFYDILYDYKTKKWSAFWYYPIKGMNFYSIKKEGDKVSSSIKTLSTNIVAMKVSAKISSSFYETVKQLNIDDKISGQFADIFVYDIDFLQESKKGDYFKIIYEAEKTDKKGDISFIKIIAAEYKTDSRIYNAFYALPKDNSNRINYFDSEAKSLQTSYLKSPFSYSKSIYPLLSASNSEGKNIVSREIDKDKINYFITEKLPVLALADGIVLVAPQLQSAKLKSSQGRQDLKPSSASKEPGNPLIISNPDGNTIYYGYLISLEKGIIKNNRIKQGQVLGYSDKRLELRIMKGKTLLNYFEIKQYPQMSLRGEERLKFLDEYKRLMDELRNM
jgi:hypothetical protein